MLRVTLLPIRTALLIAATGLVAACAERTYPGMPNFQPDVAYCYVTLANVDCFANPQEGQTYRQVTRAIGAPH